MRQESYFRVKKNEPENTDGNYNQLWKMMSDLTSSVMCMLVIFQWGKSLCSSDTESFQTNTYKRNTNGLELKPT